MKRALTNNHITVRDNDLEFIVKRSDGLRIAWKPDDSDRAAMKAENIDFFEHRMDEILAAQSQMKDYKRRVEEETKAIIEAQKAGMPIEQCEVVRPGEKPQRFVRIMPWYKRLHCWLSRRITLHKAPDGERHRYGPFYLGLLPVEVMPNPALDNEFARKLAEHNAKKSPLCRQCKERPAVYSGTPGEPPEGILCTQCMDAILARATQKRRTIRVDLGAVNEEATDAKKA